MVKSAFAKSLPSRRRKERDKRSSRHHGGGDSGGGSGGSVGRTLSGREEEAVDDHHLLYDDDGHHGGWQSSSPPRPPRVSLENNQDDNAGSERKRRWGASPSSFGHDIHDNDDDDGNAAEEEHSPAVSSISEGSIVEGTQLNYHPFRATSLVTAAAMAASRRESIDDATRRREIVEPTPRPSPVASSSVRTSTTHNEENVYDQEMVVLNDNIEMPASRLEQGRKSDNDDGSEASRRRLRCHKEEEEGKRLEEERFKALDVERRQAESDIEERERVRMEQRRLEDETTRKRTELDNYERERVQLKQPRDVQAPKFVNESVCDEGGDGAYRATRKTLIATQRADGDSQPLLDEHLSPETELRENVETGEDEDRPVIGNHSIEITEPAEINVLRGDTLNTFNTTKSIESDRRENEKKVLDRTTDPSEFTLTTSDIKSCIAAIKVANDILKADPSQDPFDGIDIERWESDLMKFGRYIVTLGDPKTTEAVEIEKLIDREKAYAMFYRGMNVNHCNAVFVHHMLSTISYGINNSREGSAHHDKIDHLAECIDRIFGVTNEDTVSSYSVSIMTGGTEGTSLKFSLSKEPTIDGHKDSTSMTLLPPHLVAMSQIFESYALEEMRPFRLQMDSTHETLIATREGAMGLQRRALELQDELHRTRNDAEEFALIREQAETEFKKQKNDFERRADSFNRMKEHYQSELVRQKEEYEREIRALKVDLAKTKHVHTEQLATEQRQRKESIERHVDEEKLVSGRSKRTKRSVRQEDKDVGSEFLIRRPTLNAGYCDKQLYASLFAETNEAGDNQFSPSIPKHIIFGAKATHESDLEESTGKHSRSRHMLDTKTPRNSRSASYEMQPPRSHRESIGSTLRTTDSNTRRDHGGRDELNGESARRFRENPLKPDIHNTKDDDVRFSDKRHNQPFDRNGRTSTTAPPSKRHKVSDNVSLKPATTAAEPTFAYQEVVRGRANRQALPGHECEECRKWFDAIGKGYDRADMVKECSRHRALHAPPSTPEDYWRLTFVDERE